MKLATICYLIDQDNNKILLGRKKYGIAKGILNGFGGKVEKSDKTIKISVIREFHEETGITLFDPTLFGIIYFNYTNADKNACAYVYLCSKWQGKPNESEEMEVSWFDLNNIPINDMWQDDKIWLPTFLEKKNILVRSYRDKPGDFPYKTVVEVGKKIFEGMHKL
jgi:8-oxo-dGTP pyrophosphatase MutT (NUDIX family)